MEYEVINERGGGLILERAALLDGVWPRMKGLLGRRGLSAGEGVILRPCSSLHTAFMRFSIDVVFLDSGGRVRKIVENLRPFRLAAVWGGREVIEMAAGALQAADLAVGDRLIFKARDG